MRKLRSVVAIAALVAAPAALNAQTTLGKFQWAGTGQSFGWWWHSPTSGNGNYMGGGSYSAQFQFNAPAGYLWPVHGTSGFGPVTDIYCIDYEHTALSTYDAYFTKLSGPLVNTRSGVKNDYLKVAWLAGQLNTAGTQATRAEIHAAMWWIMANDPTGSWKGSGATNVLANYNTINASDAWVLAANANYTSVNADEWTVVTDKCVTDHHDNLQGEAADNEVCSQEFLTKNVVPEPATMLLLGTGLLATLAMTGMLRKPPAA